MNKKISNQEQLSSVEFPIDVENDQQARMGRMLLTIGKLTEQQLEKVIQLQQEQGCKLGEAALRLGFINQLDIDEVLARQFEYSFIQHESSDISERLYMAFNWPHSEQEQIKALRSQIHVCWLLKGNKSLLVTGIDGDDQSAILSANLAIAFSQSGKRTLLVDANMRDSQLHKDLSMPSSNGLADFLAGRNQFGSAVRPVMGMQNLHFIPCGTDVLNPQELLTRDTLANLVQTAESHFDVVIFNTPSQAIYADSQILSARVPGVLLQVRQNRSRVQDIRILLSRFEATQAQVLGCVYVDA